MARIQTLPKLRPDSTDREGLGYIYRRRLPSSVVPGCLLSIIFYTFKFDFIESAGAWAAADFQATRISSLAKTRDKGFDPRGSRDPGHLSTRRDARAGAGSCRPEGSGTLPGRQWLIGLRGRADGEKARDSDCARAVATTRRPVALRRPRSRQAVCVWPFPTYPRRRIPAFLPLGMKASCVCVGWIFIPGANCDTELEKL